MPRSTPAAPRPLSADEVASRIGREGVAPLCAAGCRIRGSEWRGEDGGSTGVLFDLASVTKPMTAVAIARAGIAPRTRLGDLLPEASGTPSERVPIELLLAHRAGLDGHRPLFSPLVDGRAVDLAAALAEAASARLTDLPCAGGRGGDPPSEGFPALYSDLGYLLAGEALARSLGARDAGEAIDRLVLEPLGVGREAGTVRELASRGVLGPFAPTETVAWRGGPIEGAVHDENAWALAGLGGAGQAGIFATVSAVLRFGTAVLDALDRRDGPFAGTNLDWLVRPRPGGTWLAGFDGKSPEGSSAGNRMGSRSFGHLGFTGTSLWIDPAAKVVVALLTNRVCPTRDNMGIRSARPWGHDALFERALELTDRPSGA